MEERAIYVDIDPNDIHDAEPELLFDSHYRAKQIMLDYGTEPLIKAGSPISASGKVSNNASAIGILKRDCYRHLTSVGDVIIGGYIKSDIAQSHSGIEISDAARAAMSRLAFIGADGAPEKQTIPYDCMPEGYPKKSVQNTVFIEEATPSFTAHNGLYTASWYATIDAFIEGKIYTVKWDGVEYDCKAFTAEGDCYIGNLSIAGVGDDTGEPFLAVVQTRGESIAFFTNDESTGHTICVYEDAETITPMDESFMPVLTSPNGTKYKITVDDTGALSATAV